MKRNSNKTNWKLTVPKTYAYMNQIIKNNNLKNVSKLINYIISKLINILE